MSYDISYRVQCKDNPKLWADIGNCEANTTWNLGDMIRKSTGLEWKNEEDNDLRPGGTFRRFGERGERYPQR